ncbi:MAG: sugar phosphate nucleotidyltransferase [Patescibacteria group bacterium]
MKGVIIAGGTGSRLYPLTKVTNKHLLPVYDRPMIYFPLTTLLKAGVDDILIVSGSGHAGDFLELLSDGSAFLDDVRKLDGVNVFQDNKFKLSYAVQKEAGGIAQALSLAEDFSDHEPVVAILGDNIIADNLTPGIAQFFHEGKGAKIYLKEVTHPEQYGIAVIEGGRIVQIVEKPKTPTSNLAVIGVYLYDDHVWDVLKTLKPSGRGELEITDVNNAYIERGMMRYEILRGWWGDGGESFDSLLEAAQLIASSHSSHPHL